MMAKQVDSAILENLSKVLDGLTASNNELRALAEKQLKNEFVAKRPRDLLLGLVHYMRHHQDASFRGFSAVLLRRMGFKTVLGSGGEDTDRFLWNNVDEDSKKLVLGELVIALRDETESSVRKKVCDTISEAVKVSMDENGILSRWPEILPVLIECAKNENTIYRQSSFSIISQVPSVLSSAPPNYVQELFASGFNDLSKEVVVSCSKAAIQILSADDVDIETRQKFSQMWMPPVGNILLLLQSEKNEEDLANIMADLSSLFEDYPKFSRSIISQLIPFLTSLIGDANYGDKMRQSALELIVTLSENAPGLCKKAGVDNTIPFVLRMMSEIEDDEEWYQTDKVDETEDSDLNYVVAEQAMDRLAVALGGKTVLGPLFTVIPSMLGSSKWNERYAALMCLSVIAEGCNKLMKTELGKIFDLILSHVNDPNGRVAYAACNAIGQLCTDFAPDAQLNFHQRIIQALAFAMDLEAFPRVQAHAACALVNFFEDCGNTDFTQYLTLIFQKMAKLLGSSKLYVVEQTVTALATLADAAGAQFHVYYQGVMPVILNILRVNNPKENRLLRGKAIECISLIALAVGKEVFASDANEFLGMLKATQDSISEDDDPQISYLIASWARVCKVLGKDFEPYLQFVMPPLIKSASHKPDFAVMDSEEDEKAKGFSEEDGWEFVVIHDQKIGIKTSALEEKCTAVEMLVCYARNLGPLFSPFAEHVLPIGLSLLRFYFHEGVRSAAAGLLPSLLICFKESNNSNTLIYWHSICSGLLKAIDEEVDLELLNCFLAAFYECVEIMGLKSLEGGKFHINKVDIKDAFPEDGADLLMYFGKTVIGQFSEMFRRLVELESQKNDPDLYDQEKDDALVSMETEEDEVLNNLSRAVHIVCKTHGELLLPAFKQYLLKPIGGMLCSGQDTKSSVHMRNIQWSVCVIDDIIEYLGPAVAYEMHTDFWNAFLSCLMDAENPNIRQGAAYGIGLIALQLSLKEHQHVFTSWSPLLKEALASLFYSLEQDFSRAEEHQYSTENVIAAIGKILHHVVEPLMNTMDISVEDYHTAVSSWLKMLPLLVEEEEAPHTIAYLLYLLQHRPEIIAPLQDHVFYVLVKTLVSGLLDQSTLYQGDMNALRKSAQVALRGMSENSSKKDSVQQHLTSEELQQLQRLLQ